jgi:hypothetical protein
MRPSYSLPCTIVCTTYLCGELPDRDEHNQLHHLFHSPILFPWLRSTVPPPHPLFSQGPKTHPPLPRMAFSGLERYFYPAALSFQELIQPSSIIEDSLCSSESCPTLTDTIPHRVSAQSGAQCITHSSLFGIPSMLRPCALTQRARARTDNNASSGSVSEPFGPSFDTRPGTFTIHIRHSALHRTP